VSDVLRIALGAGVLRPHDLGEPIEYAQYFDAASELPAAWIEMLAEVDEASCVDWDRFCAILDAPSPLGDYRRTLGGYSWTVISPILEDADHRVLDRLRKFDHPSNRRHG
jgi:hypothetical protein